MANEVKYSTWRRDDIEVKAGEIKDFAFYDTKPNLFYVQNANATDIYIGLQYIPNPNKYEFKIQENSYDTIGRPLPCNHIYILNPSNNDIIVTIYSVNDVFNISILKNYALAVDSITTQSEISFKSGTSLPNGNNTIGKVDLNAGNKKIGSVSLENGNNTVGKIEMGTSMLSYYDNYIKSYLANIISALGTSGDISTKINELIGLVNNTVITRLNELERRKLSYQDFCQEITGTESTTITVGEKITNIMTIVNDGSSDILVKYFNNSQIQQGSHILKSGEVFEDIDITGCYAVQIVAKTSGDKYKCRVIGR